jgi:exodeoxyribonuclease V beta subunit
MDRYVFLKASAGTGKTFAIVVRYISLLLIGAKPNEILALTFTNKATKEMKDRVFEVVENLHLDEYSSYLSFISKQSSLSQDEILQKQKQIKDKILQSESNILTIDSFLDSILRLFSWYAKLNNDYIISQDDKDDFLEWLFRKSNMEDLQAISQVSIDVNMNLDDILQSVYTLYSKNISTYNGNGEAIDNTIQDDIMNLANKIKNHILLSSSASSSAKKAVDFINVNELLAKSWIIKDDLSDYSYFKKKEINISILDNVFYVLKEKIAIYMKQNEVENISFLLRAFKKIFNNREKYKKIKSSVSFDDITIKVHNLLKERLESSFLYFRLDNKITHLLIDEFQDTSILQFKILEPIIEEIVSGSGVKENRTLFFVGDEKQSIYRFRGANKSVIDYLLNKYNNIEKKFLDTNFRSFSGLVDYSNNTFNNHFNDFINVKANHKSNGYIKISSCDKEDILDKTILNIKELLAKKVSIDDIGVLSFSNKMLTLIEDKIFQELPEIKVITETSSMLIENSKVKAIIEYIRYLYFQDEIYWYNFSTIIGENSFEFEKYNLNINKDTSIEDMILSIINHYDLIDENTLYFLDLCFEYKDIYSFIYNIDMLKEPVVAKSNNGIKLMTIHKSKGLEFKHLILVDNLGKNKTNTNKIIFKQNDMDKEEIFFRQKNREYFDKEYSNLLKENKKLDNEDALNVLYVAITRAKESLCIIKKDKDSKFDILSLKDDIIGVITKEENKESKNIIKNVKIVSLEPYGKQDDFLKKEEISSNLSSVYFGMAMHYMLECVDFDNMKNIDIAYNLMLNKYGSLLDNKTLNTIKHYATVAIKNKDFLELIKGSRIKKELQFAYKNKIGIIDLLIEKDNEFIIIDYKSSSEEKASNYTSQMKFYRDSMLYCFNKKARSYLYFLGNNPILKEVTND